MSELSGAACTGRWWLFDSTDVRDHEAAAELCATCPVLAACGALLEDQFAITRGATTAPEGTWAGQLVGAGKWKPREHGSERGYYQHKHRREDVCESCRLAHNAAQRGTNHHKRKVAS